VSGDLCPGAQVPKCPVPFAISSILILQSAIPNPQSKINSGFRVPGDLCPSARCPSARCPLLYPQSLFFNPQSQIRNQKLVPGSGFRVICAQVPRCPGARCPSAQVPKCPGAQVPGALCHILNPYSSIRNPPDRKLIIQNQENVQAGRSQIRNPQSQIRNPKSAIPNPQSQIRNPKSKIPLPLLIHLNISKGIEGEHMFNHPVVRLAWIHFPSGVAV